MVAVFVRSLAGLGNRRAWSGYLREHRVQTFELDGEAFVSDTRVMTSE